MRKIEPLGYVAIVLAVVGLLLLAVSTASIVSGPEVTPTLRPLSSIIQTVVAP